MFKQKEIRMIDVENCAPKRYVVKSNSGSYLVQKYEFSPYTTTRISTFIWISNIELADIVDFFAGIELLKQFPPGSCELAQVLRQQIRS